MNEQNRIPYVTWQKAKDDLEKALQDAEQALAEVQRTVAIFKAYTVGREELDAHEAEELARIAKLPRR